MNFVTDADIKAKEVELSALRARKIAQDSKPTAELAVRLHDVFCRYNHTDGCAWGYEMRDTAHDWGSQTHRSWMERTEEVIKRFGDMRWGQHSLPLDPAIVPDVILAFLNIMKETN